MKIQTRDFGMMDVQEKDILFFTQPIYGFEELKRFVMLTDDEMEGFMWLQSLEESEICFILLNPLLAKPDYAPCLPADVKAALGAGDYEIFGTVAIPEDFHQSTINLKSPIVINPATQKAAQVILEDNYPIRFPLMAKKESA